MENMKKVLAIGGAVIKTAREELTEVIKSNQVAMLIHNGGSIFHDFQLATESLRSHSHKLDDLIMDYSPNEKASKLVWDWIMYGDVPPENSVSHLCYTKSIPVLMFTGLGCDFWQLFNNGWEEIGHKTQGHFQYLCNWFEENEFHYVCMGSAVIHPEVFIKAIAVAKPKKFRADVVDFLDMYRPRTRVSKFGTYYQMSHKDYLKGLL